MASIVHSIGGMGIAQRQSVSHNHVGPSEENEVCFLVGNQGCTKDKGHQNIMGTHEDEHQNWD